MDENHVVGTVKQELEKLFEVSLRATFPDQSSLQPLVAVCSGKFGDYQCNNAMSLWAKIKGKNTGFEDKSAVAEAIIKNLPQSDMIKSCSVAKPAGFVNIVLSDEWIAKDIKKMLEKGIGIWAPKLPITTVVVDYSSPNIAKEMHVGHLRSTIIGDTLARMFEYSNVKVLRRNHVGDWGTQFGMLIEYLFEEFPNWEDAGEQAIGDLQAFYKKSKLKFDSDSVFKEKAREAVVRLQGGDPKYHKAWKQICDISRIEFEQVYERLGINNLEEKGESYYNDYIPKVLEALTDKGLIEENDGARVIFIEGKSTPLIVKKSDGGFNYASTDLTALWYRLNEEKAEWIVYVTDASQSLHFENVFSAAKRAGWLPADSNLYPKTSHVPFGLVLGDDGKRFRTRSSDVVRLVDLLDQAKKRCKEVLDDRVEKAKKEGKAVEWTAEELEQTAEAIGYGAIKYADLKNNRETNYVFNMDQMLQDKGDTAVYILYAHARVCSIIRKSGKEMEDLKKRGTIVLAEPDERVLGLHLLRFAEIVEEACKNHFPHKLCEYLYNLSENFTRFYSNPDCQVVGSAMETSRLLLCEATAVVMRQCFYLLGITPVYKMI